MLFKRWITAIILIPFLLLILLKGSPLAFSLLVLAIALVSMKEYFTIVSPYDFFSSSPPSDPSERKKPDNLRNSNNSNQCNNKIPLKIELCAYIISSLIILAAHKGSSNMVILLTAFNIIIIFMTIIGDFTIKSNPLDDVAKEIQGIIYIPVFLSFLVFIRNSPNGALWIIWLWLIIGASDTGAYYCGTYFGKKPLAPKISPNKTIEGAAGGIAAAVIVGVIFGWIYIPGISFMPLLLFAAITSVAGQMGDLFESALKRKGCIKDSGIILPGHGGLLDRIDGLIFAAPVAFLFKCFIANAL